MSRRADQILRIAEGMTAQETARVAGELFTLAGADADNCREFIHALDGADREQLYERLRRAVSDRIWYFDDAGVYLGSQPADGAPADWFTADKRASFVVRGTGTSVALAGDGGESAECIQPPAIPPFRRQFVAYDTAAEALADGWPGAERGVWQRHVNGLPASGWIALDHHADAE
jgi:diadenosine tetraphosphatase ApaH/serine/threonine PP2A family protein phosphatase